MSDHGAAAQDRGVGVDHDAIFDGRMTLLTADQVTVGVRWKAERAERHALVQLHVLADVTGFADYHARAVIDEKVFANPGTGMNVDAGLFVSPLGHHPRDERHIKRGQFVRDAVHRDRFETGIAENDFIRCLAGGVAIVGSLNVGGERAAHFRDSFQQLDRHHLTFGLEVNLAFTILVILLHAVVVAQRSSDLCCQLVVQRVDQSANVIANVAGMQSNFAAVTWIQHVFQVEQNLDNAGVAGQGTMAKVIDRVFGRIARDDVFSQLGKLFFQPKVSCHGNALEYEVSVSCHGATA